MKMSTLRHSVFITAFLVCAALARAGDESDSIFQTSTIDALMEKHGLGGEPLLLRVSGCPTGCSRPCLAAIAPGIAAGLGRAAAGAVR